MYMLTLDITFVKSLCSILCAQSPAPTALAFSSECSEDFQ